MIESALINTIILICVIWQFLVFVRFYDEESGNAFMMAFPTLVVCALVMICAFIYLCSVTLVNLGQDGTIGNFIIGMTSSLLFCGLLMIKAALNPCIVGGIFISAISGYFDTGKIETWPVMEFAIELLIPSAGSGVVFTYSVIFLLLTIFSNGWLSLQKFFPEF